MKFYHYSLRFLTAVGLTGLLGGFAGIAMHELLNLVEILVFGHNDDDYLTLVRSLSAWSRFGGIAVISLVAALIWYWLQKAPNRVVSVRQSLQHPKRLYSFLRQVLHSLLQIVFVGAGGPIGKEGAPRELGALFAGRVAVRFKLKSKDAYLLMASGAAAGLAAVYQVPLSSFFFAFEVLGVAISLRSLLVVLVSTYLATFVSNPIVTSNPNYHLHPLTNGLSFWSSLGLLVCLAILTAFFAGSFRRLNKLAGKWRRKDKSIFLTLPLTGVLVGATALLFPTILGNGSALAQSAFNGLPLRMALVLFVLKASLVLLSLVSGAYGGTLTPSFALGGLLGLIVCQIVAGFISIQGPELFMLAGAASFLAITMKAPLTAAGLVIGFTHSQPILLIPILFTVALTKLFESRIFYRN
ncbi:chloride channel protein [Streptococcus sobrinus]|uniref:chloride channel protein n=1 Tax=Streptococcus sobrinus TaxID=1310 RepID=UPI0002D583EA|nr:chloride channel protein [Streptococcus sobrinus]